jgi:ferritin-like metal-binding protein YciE
VVLNAALIGAAQSVEHYEITRYGTLIAWARALGRADVARLLAANLKEEKATDKKLNSLAKRKVNRKAVSQKPKRMTRADQEAMLAASVGIPAI